VDYETVRYRLSERGKVRLIRKDEKASLVWKSNRLNQSVSFLTGHTIGNRGSEGKMGDVRIWALGRVSGVKKNGLNDSRPLREVYIGLKRVEKRLAVWCSSVASKKRQKSGFQKKSFLECTPKKRSRHSDYRRGWQGHNGKR